MTIILSLKIYAKQSYKKLTKTEIVTDGGVSIIKDAQKMVPVPLGNVIATTAGTLAHQKYVFHCITIDKKLRVQMMAIHVTEEDVLYYLLLQSW